MSVLKAEIEEYIYSYEGSSFSDITKEKIVDQSRWNTFYSRVIKDNRTGKLFEIHYDQGSTEYQESSGEVSFHEVEPKEVTVTKYVKKQTGK